MAERDASSSGPSPAATPAPDAPASALAAPEWLQRNLPLSLDAYEKAALERALIETWGDASEAARLLGIGRSTFYRKAGKHGINVAELRSPAAVSASGDDAADQAHAFDDAAEPRGVGAPKTLG